MDYVTNNLAECFNNWIKHHKSLNLDDFMDKARQLLMIKWNERRTVGKKLDGLILPNIIKKLNAKTRELNLEVVQSSEEVAEVTALGGNGFRFVVNCKRGCVLVDNGKFLAFLANMLLHSLHHLAMHIYKTMLTCITPLTSLEEHMPNEYLLFLTRLNGLNPIMDSSCIHHS